MRISTAPPAELAAALARLMDERSRRALAERTARISAIYRAGGPTAQAIIDEDDALAYALYRLPATYAASIHALGRLADRAGIAPRRMLDLGAGLGTASLAAREVWPEMSENLLLDRSAPFLALARRLAGETLAKAEIVAGDLAAPPALGAAFDLVVASYALTEIAEDRLDAAVDAAWRLCAGALVLVEPGTPRDHARLMRMRARLVAAGGASRCPARIRRPARSRRPIGAISRCGSPARATTSCSKAPTRLSRTRNSPIWS